MILGRGVAPCYPDRASVFGPLRAGHWGPSGRLLPGFGTLLTGSWARPGWNFLALLMAIRLIAWRGFSSPLGRSRRFLAAGLQTQLLQEPRLLPCGAFHGKQPQDPGGPILPGDQTVPGPGGRSVPVRTNKIVQPLETLLCPKTVPINLKHCGFKRKRANHIRKKEVRCEEGLPQAINI